MHIIVVTGGNRGLGAAIAQALSNQHTHIILACRDVQHGRKVAQQLAGSSEVMALDLCSESSIDSFTKHLQQRYSRIDVLVNNAGLFDHSGQTVPFAGQNLSNVWVTNTFGPYLLTKKLAPLLAKASQPKCVFMCSVAGHHKQLNLATVTGQPSSEIYGQSKYADLLLTALIAEKFPRWQVLAAHPGYTNTAIFNGHTAGWKRQLIRYATNLFAQSPEKGARSAVVASKQNFPTGSYLGPRYIKELYGPPCVRQLSNYYHMEDVARLETFLESMN